MISRSNWSRRSLGASALALATLALVPATGNAQADWPNKAVRIVVPYAAGGYADTRMRKIGQHLAKALGQPIVIDNKAGAGGMIGTDVVAKAAPDGYTLGTGSPAPLATNVSLYKKMSYDPRTQIAPVVLLETGPLILVTTPSLGIKTTKDLIAKAKAEPGALKFGSSGVGGAHHLSGELFASMAGAQMVHVPYKGGAPAANDLMAGHLPMMFEMGYSALPSIQTGKIVPIAVSSKKRLGVLPNVPTLDESGLPGYESYNWLGVIAAAGTPAPIIERLNRELNAILKLPDVRAMIEDTGSQIAGGTPEQFGTFIRSETDKWGKLIKAANIQPE